MTSTATDQRILSAEERNDLRKRVLAGQPLTLDEARAVFATLRQGQGVAALAGEAKRAKGKGAKKSMSDEELDRDLENLGI